MTQKMYVGTQEEIRKRIIAEVMEGRPKKEIAVKYGVHTKSISRMLKRYCQRATFR